MPLSQQEKQPFVLAAGDGKMYLKMYKFPALMYSIALTSNA